MKPSLKGKFDELLAGFVALKDDNLLIYLILVSEVEF
jgi:hypothetical protein